MFQTLSDEQGDFFRERNMAKACSCAGFNDFLKQQLDVSADARLTLVLFGEENTYPARRKVRALVERGRGE